MKRIPQLALLIAVVLSLFLALPGTGSVSAAPATQQGNFWCGNGSEAENYGFTYPTSQPHWTVGNGLVSEDTMTQVDVILDQLNNDQLAQTMILVMPEDQVGEPVNCAVHFLRYMGLGLVDGPHADNGFVWLFIVHPSNNTVEVRYGVGLGLNALTAPRLGDLKRLGVDTYAKTNSVDTSVLEVVKAYDAYVRSQYTAAEVVSPVVTNNPQGNNPGLSLFAILFFLFVLVLVIVVISIVTSALTGTSSSSTTDYPTYTPEPTHHTTSHTNNDTTVTHHSEPQHYQAPTPTPHHESHYEAPRPTSTYKPSPPPASRGGSGSGRSNRGG